MAAVLLAACGFPTDRAQSTSTATPSTDPTTFATPTGPQVTVPAMRHTGAASTATSATRRRLPLTTVTRTVDPTPTGTSTTTHPTPSPHPTPTHPSAISSTSESEPDETEDTSTSEETSTESPESTSEHSSSSSSATRSRTSTSSSKPSTRRRSGPLIAIDPGHNGGNSDHPEIVNQPVDGGYGYTNTCNTTGTETDAGYPEHQFTWNVANYLQEILESGGIATLMTRDSDDGVGPCTPVRARTENESGADAVVSIHGDGVDKKTEGFYVLTAARPPAGAQIGADSLRLARAIRDAMEAAGFPPSNTLGSDGLWTRDDLTGLNKSTRPKILIECGNMRNPQEADWMSSSSGQKRYAKALAAGVRAYLKD